MFIPKHIIAGAVQVILNTRDFCGNEREAVREFAIENGFRSSFRDWAADRRIEENFILEFCLAHVTGPGSEMAYRRSENLDRRRTVMQAWADYATGTTPANVLPFKRVS